MGNNNVKKSSGGQLRWNEWNNLQYTTSATFILTVYAKYLISNSGGKMWLNSNNPDPNVLQGEVVGGPYDTDARNNFKQAEPATANTAPLVGVLAKFAGV
ncbi:hypothetical protein IFM89_011263 [Coptis chinensis]|uniref:cellulase n=1 Tax=Coptis chinensis TaxID=261450 RepID=A0A835HDF6_9MAGN|nr:hypothetical protein IFM89_011263 [Coptis chinensis]